MYAVAGVSRPVRREVLIGLLSEEAETMRGQGVSVLAGGLVLVTLLGWLCATAGFAQGEPQAPAGPPIAKAEQVAKEAHRKQAPPGWDHWSARQREEWKKGLERAKRAVSEHARARERAAVCATEMAARRGVPLADAEQMAKLGLDGGLAPVDFEPLGYTVSDWARQGITGQVLAQRVHQEVQHRREMRKTTPQQAMEEEGRGRLEKVEFIHRKPPRKEPAAGAEQEGHGKGDGRE